jgi:hypothetical protein
MVNYEWKKKLIRDSIVDSCGQGDLSQQDALCIDNCVAKFFETNSKVGEKMQKMSQQ